LKSLDGLKVKVKSLGCRTNIYEAEAIADSFRRQGAVIVDDDDFDVGILVSCAVTATAEKKCRQAIRHMKKESPGATTVLCGCYVQAKPKDDLLSLGADIYVGNRLKGELPRVVADLIEGKLKGPLVMKLDVLRHEKWDPLSLTKVSFHTRSFVKIQDGCDFFCSYCIVPYLRGRPTSRNIHEVISEVKGLVEQGCREVVLTGVHLGLYGKGQRFDLADLVSALSKVKGLRRLRFGSIEPLAVNDKLLIALAESEIFCPHLHVPLQSGDEKILKLMNRGYSPVEFANMISKVRRHLGNDVHISTDIIVGFPGEDEGAFQNTLNFIRDLGIGRLHVFPFSPRKGTKAYDMPGRPERSEIADRVDRALEAGGKLLQQYADIWMNREVEVLIERCKGSKLSGLSRHYLETEINCDGIQGLSESGCKGLECKICVAEVKHGILYGKSSEIKEL